MPNTTFKTLTYLLSLLFACFIIACNTDEQPEPQAELSADDAVKAATDGAAMDQVTNNAEDLIYSLSVNSSGDGPCFTRTENTGQFNLGDLVVKFRNIQLVFDAGGCEAPNGMVFEGTAIFRDSLFFSAPDVIERESRQADYFDFTVDGVVMSGGTTMAVFRDTIPFFKRTKDLDFEYPNGATSSISSTTLATQIEGILTSNGNDDVFSIEGTLSGVNRNGTDYQGNIVTPLTKRQSCNWIESGTSEFYIGAFPNPAILDYGNGSCDKIGTLTLPNGQTQEVQVGRWW